MQVLPGATVPRLQLVEPRGKPLGAPGCWCGGVAVQAEGMTDARLRLSQRQQTTHLQVLPAEDAPPPHWPLHGVDGKPAHRGFLVVSI